MILAIGPFQIFIALLIPIGVFFLGYSVGKKAGYIKRVKEVENNGNKTE